MGDNLNLSIIIIAHNEEENIGRMIEGLFDHYNDIISELIIVDDASKDLTASEVEKWKSKQDRVKLIKRQPPCGVGRALKAGFASIASSTGYVLTMDSDFIGNIPEVRKLLDAAERNGYDGLIGSRFSKNSRLVNYPLCKKFMNRLFHYIVRIIFRIEHNDLTNNFKLYKASIFRNFAWKSDGFSINAELGLLPILAGLKIGEVPVSWFGRDSRMGKSKFSMLKSGPGYIGVIARGLKFSRRSK